MSKRKDVLQAEGHYEKLCAMLNYNDDSTLPRMRLMKKFRFQLLHEWISNNFTPRRIGDIGGGKGLLSYLLQQSGWDTTVIDPLSQPLPIKYKDLLLDKQLPIPLEAKVKRRTACFSHEMAADYDLLVALHAHGCNIMLLDAAAEYQRQLILLPCCIIDEPLLPAHGEYWLHCLADYALQRNFTIQPFRLNFSGQNIGMSFTPAKNSFVE